MHILKYSEWRGGSGNWYCNDTIDLAGQGSLWWAPARLLEMELDEYVKWLIEKFQPDVVKFNGELLIYSWSEKNYSKCHSFVLYINKVARDKQFYI